MKFYIIKLLFIIIIFTSYKGYTQELINNKNIIKKNYKRYELIYCNREMREKETNILKAKFNENYHDNKFKSPDSIAFSYLKENHNEFRLSKDLEEIRIKNITTTSAGNYVHLEQHINNIPVYAATATVTINNKGNVTFFVNNFKDLNNYNNIYIKPKITSAAAINLARKYFNTQEEELINPTSELIYFESEDEGLELAWKIYTLIKNRPGAWLIIINAVNERIIHVDDISQKWDFPAKVYKTNPLQKANKNYGDHVWINGFEYIYEDNNDANSIALENELETVTLRDLTIENGILKLKGPYCKVVDIVYPNNHTIPEFIPANADFDFTRDQEEFEAVMVYYHVDLAGRWVHSLLGYIPYEL